MYPLKVSYIYERDTRTDLGITNIRSIKISEDTYLNLITYIMSKNPVGMVTNKIAYLVEVNEDDSGVYIYKHDDKHYILEVFID